jgi:Domain of unknown function (DUF1924)
MDVLVLPTATIVLRAVLGAAAVVLIGLGPAQAATPAEILAGYAEQAKSTPSPERGQQFFTRKFKGNLFESCTDCHTATPTGRGKDLSSEKLMSALAPAANSRRFTDLARVENLFNLNCKDVVGRACSAQEKADVLSWLISLKP